MLSRTDSSKEREILFDAFVVTFLAIIIWKESQGLTLATTQMILAYGGFFVSLGLAAGHSAYFTPSPFSWEQVMGGGIILGVALFNNMYLTYQGTLPGAIWWWVLLSVVVRFGYPLTVRRLNTRSQNT